MSTKQNEINDKNSFITSIKLENDTDDDLIYDKSLELNNKNDYNSNLSSTSMIITPTLSSAYKGKIEVTSKGRRKIFDGVRWQILCRRPECRKQTNKKSLCITHYKEEYESNTRSSSSSSSSPLWSNNLQSFQFPSYRQRNSFDNTKTRIEIEDQNNTITTTNITDNDEQLSLDSNDNNNQLIPKGQIECVHNGRRFILKNNKWQLLCKYDNICRNIAKYEYLCIKHFELTQRKRRDALKFRNNPRSIFSNNITKRLKSNDFQISSSSITEQFDINSNENSYMSTEPIDNEFSSSIKSKIPGTKSKHNLNILLSDYSLFNKQKCQLKKSQSVQTDLTIPLCCVIHNGDHSFYSSCKTKSTSAILSYDTKSEPQSFDTNFSTEN